ncbi:MAG: hypothetical protein COA61_010460 [Zetaproteobacteria bacterium]|nr:hypothetical protein [Zetaproteobacteria bacterium]
MLTIKFEVDVNDGVIEIPEKYKEKLTRHIKVIALVDKAPTQEAMVQYSDEYIEKNWRDMIAQSLSHYDHAYYKSDQYMLDRGRQGAEKYA